MSYLEMMFGALSTMFMAIRRSTPAAAFFLATLLGVAPSGSAQEGPGVSQIKLCGAYWDAASANRPTTAEEAHAAENQGALSVSIAMSHFWLSKHGPRTCILKSLQSMATRLPLAADMQVILNSNKVAAQHSAMALHILVQAGDIDGSVLVMQDRPLLLPQLEAAITIAAPHMQSSMRSRWAEAVLREYLRLVTPGERAANPVVLAWYGAFVARMLAALGGSGQEAAITELERRFDAGGSFGVFELFLITVASRRGSNEDRLLELCERIGKADKNAAAVVYDVYIKKVIEMLTGAERLLNAPAVAEIRKSRRALEALRAKERNGR